MLSAIIEFFLDNTIKYPLKSFLFFKILQTVMHYALFYMKNIIDILIIYIKKLRSSYP